MQEKFRQLTVMLDDATYENLLFKAQILGMTLEEFVTSALQEGAKVDMVPDEKETPDNMQ